MDHLEELRETFPAAARDIKINLPNVLAPGTLDANQAWGTAIASAYAVKNASLLKALLLQAAENKIPDEVLEDAKAAAIMMAMNNVYYRFRHVVEKEVYTQKPARLRMQRLAQVASNKADFELFCLAVSAINNCAMCVRSHEEAVLKGGLTEDHVHDAVRIAATIAASAQALETL